MAGPALNAFLTFFLSSCPVVKKLTCLVFVGAGSVLLGVEGPAGGMAGSALGAHLGLQQAQLHQHRAVQAQAHLVCSDWSGGRLDRCQDANCPGLRPASLLLANCLFFLQDFDFVF